MRRPSAFRRPFSTARNIPYQCVDRDGRGSESGGVLSAGQRVWLPETKKSVAEFAQTTAFVEEVGLVCLETRWLIPLEKTNADQSQ